MTKKLLVTGGLGYIGSHFCVEAINKRYNVIAIDNLDNSKKSVIKQIYKITGQQLNFIECDIRNFEKLKQIFEKEDIYCVVHFAALKSANESFEKPILYYDVNVAGTINLLKVMECVNCNKIIFSSTACIYGEPETLPIKESNRLKPMNIYGQTKHINEIILSDICSSNKNFTSIIFRYFNVAGAHTTGLISDNPKKNSSNIFPAIQKYYDNPNQIFKVFGGDYQTRDGTCIRDYIHIMDLIHAHMLGLEKINKLSGNKVYNLGNGKGTSVLEILKTVEKVNDKKINYEIVGRRKGDAAIVITDPTLAQKELNFKCKYTIDDICTHFVKFWNI